MDSNPEHDGNQAEAQRFREAMAARAVWHLDGIDARTLTLFHHNDILKDQGFPDCDKLILAILSDENHPLRAATPPGPLLFHRTDNQKPGRLVVNVADLLFRPE